MSKQLMMVTISYEGVGLEGGISIEIDSMMPLTKASWDLISRTITSCIRKDVALRYIKSKGLMGDLLLSDILECGESL